MELHVLQVDATRPGAVGHGDAVAARARRIGGMQEHAAKPARCKDGFLGENGRNFAGNLIENVRSHATQRPVNVGRFHGMVRGSQQVHGRGVGDHLHFWVSLNLLGKNMLDGITRAILEVNDARNGVAGFRRQIEFTRIFG